MTDPWEEIVEKIIDSRFVVSTALHGVVIAEAYHIPALLVYSLKREPTFKHIDYYHGTNRPHFQYATSIDEAFDMLGEPLLCAISKSYTSHSLSTIGLM